MPPVLAPPALLAHPLFECLDAPTCQGLLQRARRSNLARGQQVFLQGDRADAFYFVASGRVKIYRVGADGQEKVFEVIRPGETFAEAMMLMDSETYVASAQALEACDLYRFPNADYLQLLHADPRLPLVLAGRLSIRLHQRLEEIDLLSQKNASLRVARYLLAQTRESDDFELPMARQLIAAQLSIQPETFSRAIRRLLDDGIIEQVGAHIRVLDRARLEASD